MSRYYSYINSTKEILRIYKGEAPLASFLKKYFSANKKFGSKDRKHIVHLCYCFFRMGQAVMNVTTEEKILTGLFLCSEEANEILAAVKPEWNEKCNLPVNEKLLIIDSSFSIVKVFPWEDQLSEGIEHLKLCESYFTQPDLFLRLRPGKERLVMEKLRQTGIDCKVVSDSCVALPNSSKIDEIMELDNEAVIQDYNSQKTGAFIKSEILDLIPIAIGAKISLWDCCAGSGGKSIMIHDIAPNIQLTVSDKRESILANLKKRFEKAGIKNYISFIVDLSQNKSEILHLKSEIIIADVPCSGSGTWSRTPEQLYFFSEEEIKKYSSLQKKIVSNAIPHLKPGGSFVYITCSVFKKENEETIDLIKEKFHLQLKHKELLKGYDKKADSMFVAVFEKKL
ncbi:MAG TPA: Fmu (Sun) domain-containing protein [Chitinophagaceae bacterium]